MNIQNLLDTWKKNLDDLNKEFDEKQKEFEEIAEFEDSSIDMDIERLYGYIDCLQTCIKQLEGLK
jgi:hypothetical protein